MTKRDVHIPGYGYVRYSLSLLSGKCLEKFMNNRSAVPAVLSLALVFGFVITMNAQTATSCSQSNVQAAVNNAARGATVTVPAGSCSWSSSVSLTKGITLTGAGVGSTVITLASGTSLINISPDSTAIANDETIIVSGFTFNGGGGGYGLMMISGAPAGGTKPFKNLIITGNKFQNTGSAQGNGNTAIYGAGQLRGVIYNNVFDRVDMPWRFFGNDDVTEWNNSAYNRFSYGSADNLFIEDNTIQYSSSYNSSDGNLGWIESGQGSRWVVRFNTWNMTNANGQTELWDVHGFQNWTGSPDSGQTGTMISEFYDNTITNASATQYRWLNLRGGKGMFFNNTYSGGSSPSTEVNQYSGGCVGLISPSVTGAPTLINDTYFFNNILNGAISVTVAGDSNACGVTEGTSFWTQHSGAFTGATGVGYGLLSARPANCTTGVGYWATDQGSWNQSGNGKGNGVFYKCTSTNTWTLYYTPYTYPRPVQTGSVIPPPSNLTVVVQ